MHHPERLAGHVLAATIVRRRERTLWIWTAIAAAFGWGVILAISTAAAVLL